ncbi:MAG: GGDEF domain-containing protein [Candidatus Omnitrophica bacterium]|nr:GGDEF domain-containing protein [Candidatus Omnitrophota bacterium]
MSFLRGLLWFLLAMLLIVVATYVTGNYEVTDRFTGVFLTVQQWLPVTLNFEQFLVILTVVSLLLVGLFVSGCVAALVFMGGRLSLAHQKVFAQAGASKKEVGHIKEQHQRQYEQLLSFGQTLTKRLDKRMLIQGIVEAASRVVSVSQANAVVSCWLLNFETDTFRFEMGRYCDETFFTKKECLPTEQPFARVLTAQKSLIFSVRDESITLLKPDQMAKLGAATGLLVVPLIVESSVLGMLIMFCHPDVLKGYEEQLPFYNAIWAELSLALAIAIQGEVAILDRLTGVHNREYFMKRFMQELERANRFQQPLSLLMIDIDDFKAVNDTLGHPQGDAVLKIIAKLIRQEVRAIDLVGRYGGEEFIAMLPETGYGEESASAVGSMALAERIRKAVDEEFKGMQKPLNLTVSVGLAVRRFPEDRQVDHRELLRLADEQLYRAKTSGKNKVCAVVPEKPEAVS